MDRQEEAQTGRKSEERRFDREKVGREKIRQEKVRREKMQVREKAKLSPLEGGYPILPEPLPSRLLRTHGERREEVSLGLRLTRGTGLNLEPKWNSGSTTETGQRITSCQNKSPKWDPHGQQS
eukprot:s1987_g8.t1